MSAAAEVILTRQILENLRSPDQLNDHPWAGGLFVRDYAAATSGLAQKSPGYQLAAATAALFAKMIPGVPPKRGKRLDTRWGAFGILAAQYFAPFVYGLPYPQSLRDAWGKIDAAILLFQFGPQAVAGLSGEERARYRLVGDEPEVAPISTISDWHVSGIEQLAASIVEREQHLQNNLSGADDPLAAEPDPARRKKNRRGCVWALALVLLALLVGIGLAAREGYKIYQLARVVQADLPKLKSLAALPKDAAQFKQIGPELEQFRTHLGALRTEASPYLRTFGPWLRWVPDYGADLAASADLLDFADQVVGLAQTSYAAAAPLYLGVEDAGGDLNPAKMSDLLVQAQPRLQQAQRELDAVLAAQARFDAAAFSPRTQSLLQQLDEPLGLLKQGLSIATTLPNLIGAGSSGPKTYMILVQNSDELRPSGGFITSVGSFVIKDGRPFGLSFEDAGDLEDWSLPYPKAPWQLREYMNSQVLVLRDANWYPDFPTAVSWIEYLYAYKHDHSVDGVIAFDQQLLVAILKTIGPVKVEGVSVPITADNVVSYMRQSKVRPADAPSDWYRKAFISQIGDALMERLLAGDGIDWKRLGQTVMQQLDQRHLLLQFDDPLVSAYLARFGWDGALKAGQGDFLMAVDTNIGFNKTNAVVNEKLTYDIDLSDLSQPIGTLAIFHTNNADITTSCLQWGGHEDEKAYPIHYCYWNYLRLYVPSGAQLLDATPHAVPADWMILNQAVPAKVDALEDSLPGLQGYGTLLVVPGGRTLDTRFTYALPAAVVSQNAEGVKTYTLFVKKQPGTQAVPLTLRVHLPAGAKLQQVNLPASQDGANLLIETTLLTDVQLTVMFTAP